MSSAFEASADELGQTANDHIGENNQHTHGCCRGGISGIVHIDDCHRSKWIITGVKEYHCRNRRHGADEVKYGNLQDRRETHRHGYPHERSVKRHCHRFGDRFKFLIKLPNGRCGRQKADCIKMDDVANDENRHCPVKKIEWVIKFYFREGDAQVGFVEEKYIGGF